MLPFLFHLLLQWESQTLRQNRTTRFSAGVPGALERSTDSARWAAGIWRFGLIYKHWFLSWTQYKGIKCCRMSSSLVLGPVQRHKKVAACPLHLYEPTARGYKQHGIPLLFWFSFNWKRVLIITIPLNP
jgi:hypothetical protein